MIGSIGIFPTSSLFGTYILVFGVRKRKSKQSRHLVKEILNAEWTNESLPTISTESHPTHCLYPTPIHCETSYKLRNKFVYFLLPLRTWMCVCVCVLFSIFFLIGDVMSASRMVLLFPPALSLSNYLFIIDSVSSLVCDHFFFSKWPALLDAFVAFEVKKQTNNKKHTK